MYTLNKKRPWNVVMSMQQNVKDLYKTLQYLYTLF